MWKHFFILTNFIFLFGCHQQSGNTEQTSSGQQKTEQKAANQEGVAQDEDAENGSIASCQEFLNYYESWSEEFVKAAREMKANPQNQEVRENYMAVNGKLASWVQEWDEMQKCPENPAYKDRFKEISDYIQTELGKF